MGGGFGVGAETTGGTTGVTTTYGGGDGAAVGAATTTPAAPVDLETMAAGLPDQLVPGMDTMDVLKLLSGQQVVDEKPGSPWSAKRPKDTGDFNIKHDHNGDGHMCDPAAALQNLQTLKDVENGGRAGKKKGKKNKGGGGGGGGEEVNKDAQAARIGFEQCLNLIMPGLLHATDFSKEIPCHTQVARKQLGVIKKEVNSWQKRVAFTGNKRNQIGVTTKARAAIARYNGFQACLKEAIPTLHEELLGVDESKHEMPLVDVPAMKGAGKKRKKNNKDKDRRRRSRRLFY